MLRLEQLPLRRHGAGADPPEGDRGLLAHRTGVVLQHPGDLRDGRGGLRAGRREALQRPGADVRSVGPVVVGAEDLGERLDRRPGLRAGGAEGRGRGGADLRVLVLEPLDQLGGRLPRGWARPRQGVGGEAADGRVGVAERASQREAHPLPGVRAERADGADGGLADFGVGVVHRLDDRREGRGVVGRGAQPERFQRRGADLGRAVADCPPQRRDGLGDRGVPRPRERGDRFHVGRAEPHEGQHRGQADARVGVVDRLGEAGACGDGVGVGGGCHEHLCGDEADLGVAVARQGEPHGGGRVDLTERVERRGARGRLVEAPDQGGQRRPGLAGGRSDPPDRDRGPQVGRGLRGREQRGELRHRPLGVGPDLAERHRGHRADGQVRIVEGGGERFDGLRSRRPERGEPDYPPPPDARVVRPEQAR